jgi:SOS response regulatory protein OraA/RecX
VVSRDARELAASVLRRRDLSARALAERLQAGGVEPAAVTETLEWLVSTGYLDDGRLARERAARLSERGWGNVAIDTKLDQEGFVSADRDVALASLEPEAGRARRLAWQSEAGEPNRVAALLARRGFSPDAVEAALGVLDGRAGPELG